jgi:hypothetical protein
MDRKSILAKLLATENVSIQYGNYKTASFDLNSRTLHIPQWNFDNKGLLDLLISHEVGHALWTPTAGWHNAQDDVPGIPRAYINIIEDIRIEKLVQRKYPGLVRSFKLGYTELLNRDFFGLEGQDIASMSFMNRVNVKSKARDLMEVPFFGDEVELFEECLAVETWEDVLAVCRKLVDYAESDREEENRQAENQADSDGEGEEQEAQASGEGEGEEQEAQASGEDEGEESDDTNDQASDSHVGGDYDESKHRVETDENFRNNEDSLVEQTANGKLRQVWQAADHSQFDVVSYEKLNDLRSQTSWKGREAFEEFKRENRSFVAMMAKEFEMRKAAKQNLRASTAKTGMIDVNKLHSYKFNDDIFARMTSIPNAKNHGLMMLVDYSGSMADILPSVLSQVLSLVSFCKKVNIPFDVYGFSGNWGGHSGVKGQLENNVKLYHLFSSKMTRAQYEDAFYTIWCQSTYTYHQGPEQLGSTPLHETLSAWPKMLREFKARNNVEKVINVVMTDGGPNAVGYGDHTMSGHAIEVEGRLVAHRGQEVSNGFLLVQAQMEDIRQNIDGVINIGYYVGRQPHNFNYILHYAKGHVSYHSDISPQLRQSSSALVEMNGYDAFFLLRASNKLNGRTETMDEDVTGNAIKSQFKKQAKSKKGQRVLATQFATAIG